MNFSGLPADILLPILRAALPAPKHWAVDVRSRLQLLSVCRSWRQIALPLAYGTVFIKCIRKSNHQQDTTRIKTNLHLVVDARCLPVVRKVVIAVCYPNNPFPELGAVIARMREAADEWTGVRSFELSLGTSNRGNGGLHTPAADHEDDISSTNSALATLMPGLRKITFGDSRHNQTTSTLCGHLVGHYANQLQLFHSSFTPAVPQDRVFAQLRDLAMRGSRSYSLENPLPRLDPEVIESLELSELSANDMWSMFFAGPDDHAITFPRLTNLHLKYLPERSINPARALGERPWALQLPGAKRVSVTCYNATCPSLENAVFPAHLESLDISTRLGTLQFFAAANLQVSQDLTLSVNYDRYEGNAEVVAASRLLATSDSCRVRKLTIGGSHMIPAELLTYERLTHLSISGPVSVDSMMEHIHNQPQLVSLVVNKLMLGNIQTDLSIPECAEHEPVASLDTQLRELTIHNDRGLGSSLLSMYMLRYLLLKIPTLRLVTTTGMPKVQTQAFIDEYVQWYPHLANIKLVM